MSNYKKTKMFTTICCPILIVFDSSLTLLKLTLYLVRKWSRLLDIVIVQISLSLSCKVINHRHRNPI